MRSEGSVAGSDPFPSSHLDPNDRHETSDKYANEIFRMGRWRLAMCVDGIQWLIQKRRGAEWRSHAYCASRNGLELDW